MCVREREGGCVCVQVRECVLVCVWVCMCERKFCVLNLIAVLAAVCVCA